MTQKQLVNITGGPGKFDLMLALFEGQEIFLNLENGITGYRVRISSIQREDGSSQSWNLKGWVVDSPSQTFHAYYSTKGNHGFLTRD